MEKGRRNSELKNEPVAQMRHDVESNAAGVMRAESLPLAMLMLAAWPVLAAAQGLTALKLRGDVGA